MRYLKKLNESHKTYEIYLNDEVIETTNKELYDIFDVDKINTKIVVDLEFYIEVGLSIVANFCIDYNIIINKKIIDELVIKIKSYTEDYILYRDSEYAEWVDEYSWIINDLKWLLQDHLPNEYKKYEKQQKSKNFNL
jgi:hypothetical protein